MEDERRGGSPKHLEEQSPDSVNFSLGLLKRHQEENKKTVTIKPEPDRVINDSAPLSTSAFLVTTATSHSRAANDDPARFISTNTLPGFEPMSFLCDWTSRSRQTNQGADRNLWWEESGADSQSAACSVVNTEEVVEAWRTGPLRSGAEPDQNPNWVILTWFRVSRI